MNNTTTTERAKGYYIAGTVRELPYMAYLGSHHLASFEHERDALAFAETNDARVVLNLLWKDDA